VFGRGVAVDHPRALALYEKACRLGHAAGCWRLGRLYLEGQSVARDRNRAARAFRDSCERGHQNGCIELRRMR
jgi:TPR repeat protein